MKSLNKAFVISVVVLGMGTVSNVSAATNSNAESALKQALVNQSVQVTKSLTEQLKQSIKLSLNKMALPEGAITPSSKLALNKKQNANKNKLTAEEE